MKRMFVKIQPACGPTTFYSLYTCTEERNMGDFIIKAFLTFEGLVLYREKQLSEYSCQMKNCVREK